MTVKSNEQPEKDIRPILVQVPSELHHRISEAKWRTRKPIVKLISQVLATVDWEAVE